ncbi:HD domain-containing protein [Roseisalinus antarcticus]|uniref:5'-nucleotidase n=1 Tax=Roseisalinus antarcticus TaxID=254357 RepID=A0A1Y5TJV4_9RHOB|nr:HD domain-containing protein [Roseisalinus antarcticus]SLN65667.1 5'-nucleotidase [Roseisalinus antarcticus]
MSERLAAQLGFLIEADKLKRIARANVLMDGSRRENSAEHSWHLALWAMIFEDEAAGADMDRVLPMCLVHDLLEIDSGDHPDHLDHPAGEVADRDARATARHFGLLPADQGSGLRALWEEFEAGETPEARFVRRLDHAQPVLQELGNPAQTDSDRDVLRGLLTTGRTAALHESWPDLHRHAMALLDRNGARPPEPLAARLRFLAEADRLKTILRGTTIFDGSRRENSAEHSWHLALFAHLLGEHAARPADTRRALRMLVLHDLVEIDAGDAPIHGDHDPAEQEAKEQRAADRLYGLLPGDQGQALRRLWDEFEAAETDDAVFAKSIDRVQPVMANLECGGGTWISYAVDREKLDRRVGDKVRRGAPALWQALTPRIDAWFAAA